MFQRMELLLGDEAAWELAAEEPFGDAQPPAGSGSEPLVAAGLREGE